MNKLWKRLLVLGLVVWTLPYAAWAEIRETQSMQEIIPLIGKDTLVVFDIDNTVLESRQTLGSDQFFGFLVKKATEQGLAGADAIKCALKNASLVQPTSRVRPVEAPTPRLIAEIQKRKIPHFALTARPIAWASKTLQQLNSIRVDFTKSSTYSGDINFGPKSMGRYLGGVVFMSDGGDKGQYLVEFLKAIDLRPRKIVFVDDKLKNVESVEAALNGTPIKHISFRYGAADERVKNFNSDVAEVQWSYFHRYGKFIPDGAAYEILAKGSFPKTPVNCSAF